MASVVLRIESRSGNYLDSEIVDASTLPNARAKARRLLNHWDANAIMKRTRLDNYEYWTVVEPQDADLWLESKAQREAKELEQAIERRRHVPGRIL